ncbi:MAG: 4-hydroxy-3-methylbut-2-enyl diphosphate reductase [Candidatus Omnitrophica bacterium]|nr:4-hydroxy-3-methylbut-2-enyl diphosphate reductase [Candidatus Omnitrophota bacterium]
MKVVVASSAGFCFGVRRAIEMAEQTVRCGKEVVVLGDIVHNQDVVQRIQQSGVKKITRLGKGEGKILLIRAHGCSQRQFQEAILRGYKIVDATCPMVKHIHRLAQKSKQEGKHLVVIGDRDHDEVRGILGQVKGKVTVFRSDEPIPWEKLVKAGPLTVVVQSTEDLEKVERLRRQLRQRLKNVKFYNTICQPTRNKQKEIRCLPLEHDMVIVIGSRNSANTRRLFEIARVLNPKTYWVQSAEEVQPTWLEDIESVGVTAGASTPDEITQAVVQRLQSLARGKDETDSSSGRGG